MANDGNPVLSSPVVIPIDARLSLVWAGATSTEIKAAMDGRIPLADLLTQYGIDQSAPGA